MALLDASLANPDGAALYAEQIAVAHRLDLRFHAKPTGQPNLAQARVGGYYDSEATWPEDDQLLINGLTYETIEDDGDEEGRVLRRLRWVQLSGEYRPQPYERWPPTNSTSYRRM